MDSDGRMKLKDSEVCWHLERTARSEEKPVSAELHLPSTDIMHSASLCKPYSDALQDWSHLGRHLTGTQCSKDQVDRDNRMRQWKVGCCCTTDSGRKQGWALHQRDQLSTSTGAIWTNATFLIKFTFLRVGQKVDCKLKVSVSRLLWWKWRF